MIAVIKSPSPTKNPPHLVHADVDGVVVAVLAGELKLDLGRRELQRALGDAARAQLFGEHVERAQAF
jgi:hypothetical protein